MPLSSSTRTPGRVRSCVRCWTSVERFCGSLKRERMDLHPYATRQEARADVVDYIEMFYNSKRLHSYLGYVSPNAFEVSAKVA